MDEILDYLLWKHREPISRGVCLISGFALGIAPVLAGNDRLITAACSLLAATVAIILMSKNDESRDYYFDNPKEKKDG